MMRLLPLLLGALLLAAPAEAQRPPRFPPAQLTLADQTEIARIEAYLNGIHSLYGRFLQIADDGKIARGQVWMQRPGKMRFEYEPPNPILMVADGSFLVFRDHGLDQTSYLPLGSTPVAFLVRSEIRLVGGDVYVTHLERGPGVVRVTVRETKDPNQGALTLIFGDQPLSLQQWAVLDAQGRTTRVTLTETQFGGQFNQSLFKYVEVPRGASGGSRAGSGN